MTQEPSTPVRLASSWMRIKLWHLALLVGFVALAIVEIQNHRQTEPVLIALAAFGFALYWVLGWVGWRVARRFEARLGSFWTLVLYLIGLASLFLVATIAFLLIEHVYLTGRR